MLVIVSPAKTLDFESPLTVRKHTQPRLLKESERLVETLRALSPAELAALMGISDKLSGLNAARYQEWSRPFTPDNARQALYAFQGDVYVGMQAREFSAEDRAFAQKHLRILSGLYGVLRPLDLIRPYRLEMGTRLATDRGTDLYGFWGDRVTRVLREDLAARNPFIVNLASEEYFRAVDVDALDVPVISPVFRDYRNGKYKIISFFAKKARGMMASWIIRNRVRTENALRSFNEGGYRYSAAESSPERPVFLRRDKAA